MSGVVASETGCDADCCRPKRRKMNEVNNEHLCNALTGRGGRGGGRREECEVG